MMNKNGVSLNHHQFCVVTKHIKPLISTLFQEQVEWAVDEGADYIIGETFMEAGEAYLALEAIQKYGKGTTTLLNLYNINSSMVKDIYYIIKLHARCCIRSVNDLIRIFALL